MIMRRIRDIYKVFSQTFSQDGENAAKERRVRERQLRTRFSGIFYRQRRKNRTMRTIQQRLLRTQSTDFAGGREDGIGI